MGWQRAESAVRHQPSSHWAGSRLRRALSGKLVQVNVRLFAYGRHSSVQLTVHARGKATSKASDAFEIRQIVITILQRNLSACKPFTGLTFLSFCKRTKSIYNAIF